MENASQTFFTAEAENSRRGDTVVILRQVRESFVELFIAIARALFFWIPGGDVAKGKALMAFHPIFIVCVVGLFFFSSPKSPLRFFIILFTLLVVASQWLLGGCVVTRAEQRLTGNKETILDPFLTLAHIPVSRETRNAATIGGSTAICAILMWAYACDYFHEFRMI